MLDDNLFARTKVTKPKPFQLSVQLSLHDVSELDRLAQKAGLSRAGLVRELIRLGTRDALRQLSEVEALEAQGASL